MVPGGLSVYTGGLKLNLFHPTFTKLKLKRFKDLNTNTQMLADWKIKLETIDIGKDFRSGTPTAQEVTARIKHEVVSN